MSEGLDRQNPASQEDRIGPARIVSEQGLALGARVYLGETSDGQNATVWAWPSDQVSADAIPKLLAIIEGLEVDPVPGLAPVVHGSLSADRAVVVFARPDAATLVEAVTESRLTPAEAIAGGRDLALACLAARDRGFRVGCWDLREVACPDDDAPWTLLSPGIRALPTDTPSAANTLLEAVTKPHRPELADAQVEPEEGGPEAIEAETSGSSTAEPDDREIFAIGATLFYALTGGWAWDAEDLEGFRQAQLEGPPRALDELNPDLAKHKKLQEVVASCLTMTAESRPSSLDELLEELNTCMEEAQRLGADGDTSRSASRRA